MVSYENEVAHLPKARALESRAVFSVHPELRGMSWIGVLLVAGGVGLLLSKHLDRIGPVVISLVIAAAAAASYAFAWWRRERGGFLEDSAALLGALLLSADLAYVESQFRLLETGWPRHLLILFGAHAIAAYAFRSRPLLSLSITALAGWLGLERNAVAGLDAPEFAVRALVAAAIVLAWREANRRGGGPDAFARVFEHFAAHFALVAGLALVFHDATAWLGCALTLAVAAVAIRWGIRQRHEGFVLYAYLYAVIAFVGTTIRWVDDETLRFLYIVVAMFAAIVGLIVLHARFKRNGE